MSNSMHSYNHRINKEQFYLFSYFRLIDRLSANFSSRSLKHDVVPLACNLLCRAARGQGNHEH